MYRNGSRKRDLVADVGSRSRSIWLESRKCVDDGRGRLLTSSPCELKLHRAWAGEAGRLKGHAYAGLAGMRKSFVVLD